MKPDELDRLLREDDGIVPSSGFAEAVMKAVLREAATPAPIAFPWKKALPGIICAATAVIAGISSGVAILLQPAHALPPGAFQHAISGIVDTVMSNATVWTALVTVVITVVAVTSVPAMLSERGLRVR